jgi:hypothetical protein
MIIANKRVGNIDPRSIGFDEELKGGTSAVEFAML